MTVNCASFKMAGPPELQRKRPGIVSLSLVQISGFFASSCVILYEHAQIPVAQEIGEPP
jgi:hypothetical protein